MTLSITLIVCSCFHKAGLRSSEVYDEDNCDVPFDDEKWSKLEGYASFDDYVNIDKNIVAIEATTIREIADGIQQELVEEDDDEESV